MHNLRLGIVILNYNTSKETLDCIESIEKYTKYSYTIYVVDNCSSDCSMELFEEKYKDKNNIVLIESKENRGYSAGNNLGIKQAILDGCKIICIVNSDVELLNDAFSIMTETLMSDEAYMMIGPSVINNDKTESQIARKKQTFKTFFFARHPFCDIPVIKKYGERNYEIPSEKIYFFDGSVSGCCFCMRAEDFIKIDYLDENVFLYSEEDIIAYKMEKQGRKAVVNSEAKIWHKENVSTKKRGSAFVQFHRWSSVLYLLKTYAEVSKACQIFVCLWNALTWSMLSVISKKHRKLHNKFWKRNLEIVFKA